MRIIGGYKTKQRESILECLRKNPDRHLTVDDIVETLREGGENVGRTTVYRYIDKLCDEGIVRKYVVSEGESACYQLCTENCREHFHLMCVKCGKLIHTECDYLCGVGEHIKSEHGFVIDPSRTVLYGVCGECRQSDGGSLGDSLSESHGEKCRSSTCGCEKCRHSDGKNKGE